MSRTERKGRGGKTAAVWFARPAFRYGVLAVLFWLGLYWANYLTVYLQALGFSSKVIGYVTGAAAATGMLGNFLVGRISDRLRTVKWAALVLLAVVGVLFLLFPAVSDKYVLGFSLALLWWPLACLFRAPVCTLVENWIVRGGHKEGFNYGAVRAGGSVGSCISSVAASLMVTALYGVMSQKEAVGLTYTTGGILMLVCALYALSVGDVRESAQKVQVQKLKIGRLMSDYYFVVLLIFNFALNFFINPPFVFLPYILTEAGIDSAMVGLIVGWESLLEVPMLFLLVHLRRKIPLHGLLIVSGGLFALNILGQGVSHSLAMLLVSGVFFGCANGLNFSCGFEFVYRLAPAELKATAHTMYTIASAAGIIAGNFVGGGLLERIGTRPFYYLFALAAFLVSAAYAFSFFLGKKVWKKELPG